MSYWKWFKDTWRVWEPKTRTLDRWDLIVCQFLSCPTSHFHMDVTIWQWYHDQSARTTIPIRIPSQIAVDCKSVHSEGGYIIVPRKLLNLRRKLAGFKLAVSLEPFDWFWCFNFWVTTLDVDFHCSITAGAPDPYNRHNTAAASYGQHCYCTINFLNRPLFFWGLLTD